jgi:PKD repeat protein
MSRVALTFVSLVLIIPIICSNAHGQDTNKIIASRTEGCAPLSVKFSYSDENVLSYFWEFSNGFTSRISEPTILFQNPGKYDAMLTITLADSSKRIFEEKGIVAVGDLPDVAFSSSANQLCLGDTLSLINQSNNATSYIWDFGDGQSSVEKAPKHIYQTPGDYTITLVAISQYGCSNMRSADDLITVHEIPKLNYTTDKTTVCENDPQVSFKSSEGLSEYLWDFGDGAKSTEKNPSHKFQKEGKYTVSLTGVGMNGCISEHVKKNISFHKLQKVDFALSDSVICSDQSVVFSNSTMMTDSIAWMINGKHVSSKNDFAHIFENSGNHLLSLYHQDKFGCVQHLEKIKTIDVLKADNIDVEVSAFEGCVPMTVKFTNKTSDGVNYLWYLGDSIISGQSIEFTFEKADTIPIKALTTHQSGCMSSFTFDSAIIAHESKIQATVTNVSGCAPLETSFHLSTENVTNALWNFGNGLSSDELNPTFFYTNEGTYTPTVTFTDEFGCRKTIETPGNVEVFGSKIDYSPPEAMHICSYEEVRFSGDLGKDVWEWDFGDGEKSTEKNPVHQYSSPGKYIVSLKSNNKYGCGVVIDNYNEIIVSAIAPPKFEYVVNDCNVDNIVDFIATKSGNLNYSWKFGDGKTGEGNQLSHSYSSEGYYHIQVTASDIYGCSAIASRNILVDYNMLDCIKVDSIVSDNNGKIIIPEKQIPIRHQPVIEVCSAPYEFSFDKPKKDATAWLWDFKDGTTSTEPNPTHTFWYPGSFDIDIYLTLENGNLDTLKNYLKIIVGHKKLDFEYSRTAFCDHTEVAFQSAVEEVVNWNWDFGDGEMATISYPVKSYSVPGIYQVSLESQDSMGCHARSVHNIAIGNPYINLSLPKKICFDDSLTLNHNIEGFTNYNWSFGDSARSSEKYPSYQFQDAGKYKVNLELTDQNDCKTIYSSMAEIEVVRPEALFKVKGNSTGCNSLEVQFVNLSKGAVSYLWDFGDGRISSDENPNIEFGIGSHTVSLIAINGDCSATYALSNVIQVYELAAGYSIEQDDICLPSTVEFKDASINATEWRWDFGDGEFSTERNPQHIFLQKPNKKITLQVKNQYGCQSVIGIDSIKIHKTELSVKNKNGCIPFRADFSDNSSDSKSWDWDFGNGHISNEKNPSTIYDNTGSYGVRLITTSSTGCKDTSMVIDMIKVGELNTDFSVDFPPSLCSPLSATFTNHSIGADDYTWIFGDGASSSSEDPTHIYTTVGDFDVSLIAQNKFGCKDTVVYHDLVKTLGPQADFIVSDSIACYPSEMKITDKSVSAIKWEWIFSDGNTSSNRNPSHSFKEPGNYSIAMLATDKYGCTELSIKDSISLIKVPKSLFSVDNLIYCQPALVELHNQSKNLQNAEFYWEFGNQKKSGEKMPAFTINEPGSYKISLTTVNEGFCRDTFTLLNPIQIKDTSQLKEPDIYQLTVKDDKEIEIRMNPYQKNNFLYHLVYKKANMENTFQVIDTIKDPLTALFVDNNVLPQSFSYDYKIQSHVSCNSSVPINEINTYSSILLKSGTEEKNIRMDWSHYKGHDFGGYSILRKNENAGWTEIQKVDYLTSTYLDEEDLCPIDHIYKIVANDLGGKSYFSESNTAAIRPQYNVFEEQQVEVIRSTVVDNQMILTEWHDPEIGLDKVTGYEILKSSDGNDFTFVQSVPAGINSWLDSDVRTGSEQYKYKIAVINTCDVIGLQSNPGTSILLQKKTNQYQNHLFWSPYEGWKEGVDEYLIQEKNDFGIWETIHIVSPDNNSFQIDLSVE